MVSGSDDHDLRIWRVGSLKSAPTPELQLESRGKCVKTLRGHTGPVTSVCFNSDGTMMLSTSRDGTARLWDTRRLVAGRGTNARPDGDGDRAPPIRQVELLTGFISDVTCGDFASDNTYAVVSGYDPYVRLYPMFNDARINARQYKCQAQIRAHSDWVLSSRFWHPAEERMVLADDALEGRNERYGEVDEFGNTQEFAEWVEPETGIFGHEPDSSDDDSASSQPDDDDTASSDDECTSGEAKQEAGHRTSTKRRETKRQKRRRIRKRQKEREAKAAAAAERRETARLKPVKQWPFMCASAGADYSIKVWNVFSQKLVQRMQSGFLSATDQQHLLGTADAGGAGGADVNDVLSKEVEQSSGHTPSQPRIHTSDGRAYCSDGHVDQVTSLDFSPDGSLLVSAGGDGRVILWSVESGCRVETLTAVEGKNTINMCRFSPDGCLIAGCEYGQFRLWRNKGSADEWMASKAQQQ